MAIGDLELDHVFAQTQVKDSYPGASPQEAVSV
jgi:hypothetical protein